MGLSDFIVGYVDCPYCGETQYTNNQTKSLRRRMNDYEPGTLLVGGPFLNGEHPIHYGIECMNCKKTFWNTFIIQDQVITKINSYKTETYDKMDFWFFVEKFELIEIIKKNCITTILLTDNIKRYNYNIHLSHDPDFELLLALIARFQDHFNDVSSEEFNNYIFDDLESWVNIQYLEEVGIDFSRYFEFKMIKDDSEYAFDDGYNDFIAHLRVVVKDNISILKKQITDYYENRELLRHS